MEKLQAEDASGEQSAGKQHSQKIFDRVSQEKLATNPTWLALGHYLENTIFPGYTSLVDDSRFFLAAEGKTNPAAELEATLKLLFEDSPSKEQRRQRCRIPAREFWLRRELQLSNVDLPRVECRRFATWRDALRPVSASLIYAASYLNNPASSFGHTLLRFEGMEHGVKSPLFAYSASYAAATAPDPGVIFALRGIFGGYHGYFTIGPYYLKISEYSDVESRDIWEYELELRDEEIQFLLAHLWELKNINFDYYFLDENCAYQLLWMLHVLRPDLDLVSPFWGWAIPSDTVRVVAQAQGLVRNIAYRPATGTYLLSHEHILTPEEQQFSQAIAYGELALDAPQLVTMPAESRARILEAGHRLLNYAKVAGKVPDAIAEPRAHSLLRERSRIPLPPQLPQPKVPEIRPDEGHKTRTLRLGVGVQKGEGYTEMRIRPAYHSLLDPQEGYPRGSGISLLTPSVRLQEEQGLTLENFSFVKVTSFTPRTSFVKPKAWEVEIDLKRSRFRDGNRQLSYGIDGGAGVSALYADVLQPYLLISASARGSEHYTENFAVGAGPRLGLIVDEGEGGRTMLEGRLLRYVVGDEHRYQQYSLSQAFFLDSRQTLDLSYSWTENFRQGEHMLQLSWSRYF